ncbi:MAG: cache domain-containing protein, partial [Thermotogota bacterium]
MFSLKSLFRFRTLGRKIIVFSLFVLVITGVVFMVLYYFNTNDALLKEKQTQTRTLVNSVLGVLEVLNQEVDNGVLTMEEAQQRAKSYVDIIRYEGDNYFFVINTDARMVFHPISKELNGTSVKDDKDPNGIYLFREMVQVAEADGDGFVDYHWPKAGSKNDEPKVSYVKLFESWDWILGTGIYVDDVRTTLISTSMIMIIAIVIIIGLSVLLALLFGRSISKRVGNLKDQ